jgi:hypothetical protein
MVKKRISLKIHDKKEKRNKRQQGGKMRRILLSKDIDIEEEMKDIEANVEEKTSSKTSNLKFQSQNFIRNLKFKPQNIKEISYHIICDGY